MNRLTMQMKGEQIFRDQIPIYVNRVFESFELMEHSHDFLEITYVSEGSGTHYVGEEPLPVVRGDIFLIPVGVSHVFRPVSTARNRPLVVYNCLAQTEALKELLASFPGGGELQALLRYAGIRRYEDRDDEAHRLFQRLYQEYSSTRPGRETALFAGLLSLLLYLHRLDCEDRPAETLISSGMDRVLGALHRQFDQPLKVKDMSPLAGVGERQFHRLFKRLTGMGFTDYLQSLRIHEACRLLQSTGRKVSDIAAAVGYQDTAFFNELFKKKTGVSPRAYRKRNA